MLACLEGEGRGVAVKAGVGEVQEVPLTVGLEVGVGDTVRVPPFLPAVVVGTRVGPGEGEPRAVPVAA